MVEFTDAQQVKSNEGGVIYILCELCSGGTILDLLEKYNGKLTEAQIVHVMVDVCTGIKHMHDKGIIHRDIKLNNILSLPK